MWQVEYTDEFAAWWATLDEAAQDAIDRRVGMLEAYGPSLGCPYVDTVNGSRHANMKELRATQSNRPYRVLFVFDPRRQAILLVGGDKAGDKLFYERTIPQADKLYDDHLAELKREGLI